jgi:glycine/D-amino acid oxidase-like deaminating enzyme
MNAEKIFVVGGGLAGTMLTIRLREQGIQAILIDKEGLSNSSRIAAGLYHGLAFRIMGASWRASEMLDEAERFYAKIQAKFNTQFYYPSPVIRIHQSLDEVRLWQEKQKDPFLKTILAAQLNPGKHAGIRDDYGSGIVQHAGFLDIKVFLKVLHQHLKESEAFVNAEASAEDFVIGPQSVHFKGEKADKVIFSEGYLNALNPWFKNLPMNPAKGDVFILRSSDLKQEIVNGGVYLVPLGGDYFKAGASFTWDYKNDKPDKAGYDDLMNKLTKLISAPFTVENHLAGIRPTVSDRRPLVGFDPQIQTVGIFNGLGTRGVMLSPLIAKEMAEYCAGTRTELPLEYSVNRFKKRLLRCN